MEEPGHAPTGGFQAVDKTVMQPEYGSDIPDGCKSVALSVNTTCKSNFRSAEISDQKVADQKVADHSPPGSPETDKPLEIGFLSTDEHGEEGDDKIGESSTRPDELMKQWMAAAKLQSYQGDDLDQRPSSTPVGMECDFELPSSIPLTADRMAYRHVNPDFVVKAPPKISPWLKCVTEEEGYTFYYNTVTGESSWENPDATLNAHREIEVLYEQVGTVEQIQAEKDTSKTELVEPISDLGSPSLHPSSMTASLLITTNHTEKFPSAEILCHISVPPTDNSSPVKNAIESTSNPEFIVMSPAVEVMEEQLEPAQSDNPSWMKDAKNLMKLLQKDSPLPPLPSCVADGDIPVPRPKQYISSSFESLEVDNIELDKEPSQKASTISSPVLISGEGRVTPLRDMNDSESVASVRSAGSRGSRNHQKNIPGQISPAISAGGSKNSNGQSALHITAVSCNAKALSLLLVGGFDPDVLDAEGRTAVMLLCMLPDLSTDVVVQKKKIGSAMDRLTCLEALITHGADLGITDADGNSALHLCVLAGSRCADSEIETAESEACTALAVSCIGMLIDSGADISMANVDGDSPLHLAAKLGQLEMMQVIMDRSSAHHQLYPSPAAENQGRRATAGKTNTNGTIFTPSSALPDSNYGNNSFGNFTCYTSDASDYILSGTASSKTSPQGRLPLPSKGNQHSSSDLSVQSLSYSPMSSDLGKHYTIETHTGDDPAVRQVSIEAKTDAESLETQSSLRTVPPDAGMSLSPITDEKGLDIKVTTQKKVVSFAVASALHESPITDPHRYMDDSVPMHQTLWDTIAACADHPVLSPWGETEGSGKEHVDNRSSISPIPQQLEYDVGRRSGTGYDLVLDVISNNTPEDGAYIGGDVGSYQEQSEWYPYQSDEGYTYYYNSITGETRWELPGNESFQQYNEAIERDDPYYPELEIEMGNSYDSSAENNNRYGQYGHDDYYEDEVPVWKQGGGMKTVVRNANGTDCTPISSARVPPMWDKNELKAPHSNIRDTNTKLSLAPHSPVVIIQDEQERNDVEHRLYNQSYQQGRSTVQGMVDYVHTPVKRDDRTLSKAYGVNDKSSKHILGEHRADLMSPPMKALSSEDTLENALMSPHLTRPPRISASPIPMAPIYTPSKAGNGRGSYLSPLTSSPTAGFFSPTAPTPRQMQTGDIPLSPDPTFRDLSRADLYDDRESEEYRVFQGVNGQVLNFGYANDEVDIISEKQELAYAEEDIGGQSLPADHQDSGGMRYQRAPSVSSLSDDQSDGSSITVRHLEVWNKFFENAIKSGESKKVTAKRNYLLEQYQPPSKSSRQSSLQRSTAKPAALRPTYAPVERTSKANKLGNRVPSSELWPEELGEDIYGELIADALMLLSQPTDVRETNDDHEEYILNKDGEYVAVPNGPSKDDFTMGSVALLAAAAHEDVETVEQLLVLGVYPSCVDSNIRTPLHHAAHNGANDVVALLNDYGADVDARDSTGQTPLHVACCYGHVNIVRALLESAATPDARNDTNGVPMHFAAAGGHIDCIILLREYGASVFAIDSYGTSVLSVAESVSPRSGHMQRVISILRSLSEADSRQAEIDTSRNSSMSVSGRDNSELLDRKHRNDSNPNSPDSSRRKVSKKPSKAQEIRRLAERENQRSNQPGAQKGDASSRGMMLLASAVERAQGGPSGRKSSSSRSNRSRGMELEREEYTYEAGNDSSGSSDDRRRRKNTVESEISPHSSIASNSSSQRFMDPRKIKQATSNDRSAVSKDDENFQQQQPSDYSRQGYNSVAQQTHIPLKVVDTPASPPKPMTRTRDHSHSFSESEASNSKQVSSSRGHSISVSEEEEDSTIEPVFTNRVSKAVGGMVWGVASSLLGMISGSKGDSNGNLDKIPEEESVDSWKALAPPTDHELHQRGLGFYHPPSPLHRGADGELIIPQSPRPPDIVAAELDAKIVAYKKGLTPRRDVIVPPSDVILAVDMARAGYIDPLRRPAPLNLHIPGPTRELLDKIEKDISVGPSANHSSKSNYEILAPRKSNNGYSMGTSVPDGVRWRYVDVLNTSNPKKKSPSKSPKHRISTVAAINATKSGESEASLLFNSGGDAYTEKRTVSSSNTAHGFSITRKASV